MTVPQPPSTPYAFVSYASADRDRVEPVVAALQHAGVAVWLDRQGIAGGESYALAIAEAVEGCAAFVLMTSTAALVSRNVRQELALAWRYERPYVPLLLEPVAIPKEVAYWLEASQWVEVLDHPEAAWLPQVLAALAPLGIAPAPPPPAPQEQLPGREPEQVMLRDAQDTTLAGRGSLVLIGGEAGVGKTALAEATLREAAGRGFAVLEGHCFDLAGNPALRPLHRPLRPLCSRARRPRPARGVRPARHGGRGAGAGRHSSCRCRTSSPPWPPATPWPSCWTTCTGPTRRAWTCYASWRARSRPGRSCCWSPTAPTS